MERAIPIPFPELGPNRRLVATHRPWPRLEVETTGWRAAADELAAGRWTLLGLWGESQAVHMAVLRDADEGLGVISLSCLDHHFPSVGLHHPPAIRPERAIQDLFGLVADGTPDERPWLDHGRWEQTAPLGSAPGRRPPGTAYSFLKALGPALHEVPVGPVHAGVIEPGHFRFHADGETVVRMEERLGYAHKGVEGLMAGADIAQAAVLAGRVSGDSTVAYGLAFARAVENALMVTPPPRAIWLRALMAEMERLANHLGDVGAICNDASFAIMNAHCAILRERVLRVAGACFGHRLMMDRIVPGGVATDLDTAGMGRIVDLLDEIGRRFPRLVELYDNTASLQDRVVGTGRLEPALARRFGCGGFVGRASGRSFDARRWPGYSPYDVLRFDTPVRTDGDVNARVWIRINEIEQSLALIRQIVAGMPTGPLITPLPPRPQTAAAEGMALVEGFRGDILAW
uniref:hydrogenase large subunit n=1 Tax=Bradyrhizobium sp. TaxID=376 RepID=UPI00260B2EFC